jgi:mannose-1-phosphate guanylyltransferase/phosphomannomutase
VALSYATEPVPLGTAGSVKNAERGLRRDEPFLVVSGDAMTDLDLTDLIDFHRRTGAQVTVGLARKPNVLEFGNVITADDGRIERFIEKPSWGQVFSDTVNTGIYVVQPEVLDLIEPDEVVDWSRDVFPRLIESGEPVYGYVTDAYWEDVGTIESYLAVQREVLSGPVDTWIAGFEVAPRVWLGAGAVVDPSAVIQGPCYIGANTSIERDCVVGPNTVLCGNVVVRRGSRVIDSVLDAAVYVDTGCEINSAIVGRSTELRSRVHVDPGAVIGDQCVLEEEASIAAGVHVYPTRSVEAGARVEDNVIWESQAPRAMFGPRGFSGIMNLDVTAEKVVRLAAAFATLLPKGAVVAVGRDHSRAARAMNRALAGSLTAAGLGVRDLRVTPLPILRSDVARSAQGGVYLRTSIGRPESLDLLILDGNGVDLPVPDRQRLERIFVRREFRRAFPGDIGDIHTPHRTVDEYAAQLAGAIDTRGVAAAGLKVVVDTGLGAASLVLPRVLTALDVTVMTVNNRLDEEHPTSTRTSYHAAMASLGELVASSRSDLGVRFDPTGERLSLVDETGRPFDHGRALLVMLDLVAAERRGGVVALPSHTTRVADQVTAYHGVEVQRNGASTASLSRLAQRPDLIFAGDGQGGFIVPEMGPTVDAIAAFVRLVGLVARTKMRLSAIDHRIPKAHVARAAVPTPWARRGAAMRTIVEAAGSHVVETDEGVQIRHGDDGWALAVPDDVEAVIRLWVEAGTDRAAEELLARWSAVIESAVA